LILGGTRALSPRHVFCCWTAGGWAPLPLRLLASRWWYTWQVGKSAGGKEEGGWRLLRGCWELFALVGRLFKKGVWHGDGFYEEV
jgi:hypothetical protein